MREWIDLVCEGSKGEWNGNGPLYHGTDILSLVSIMLSNEITPSIDDAHVDNKGVSFTPSPGNAWGFAERSSEIFSDNHNHPELNLGRAPTHGAIIECDSAKLRQHWRLVDYVDHLTFDDDEEGTENEVRCLGIVKPLDQVVTSFSCRKTDLGWFLRFLESDYGRQHWCDFDVAPIIKCLKSIPQHPKYRSA